MFYLRNVGIGVSFHDLGISSWDILNETEKGIDQPKAVEREKEENNDCEKEKVEIPAIVDDLSLSYRTSNDHQINNLLGYIINHTFKYFVKEKNGKIIVV